MSVIDLPASRRDARGDCNANSYLKSKTKKADVNRLFQVTDRLNLYKRVRSAQRRVYLEHEVQITRCGEAERRRLAVPKKQKWPGWPGDRALVVKVV
jgi:hypothetical protein